MIFSPQVVDVVTFTAAFQALVAGPWELPLALLDMAIDRQVDEMTAVLKEAFWKITYNIRSIGSCSRFYR